MTGTQEINHAEQNAKGWMENISQMVEALYGTCEECGLIEGCHVSACPLDNVDDREEAEQTLRESPLSVEVRSGWASCKEEFEAEEFMILLSTGGPALRIIGELDQYNQPINVELQWQDWGTPWTRYAGEVNYKHLETYCQQFYFGE